MEFIIQIGLNIFCGIFIYFILKHKLLKSVPLFLQKKQEKVMNEIVKDFNETAERNISILENRIAVMKRFLIKEGQLKSIDINICDHDENDRVKGVIMKGKTNDNINNEELLVDPIKIDAKKNLNDYKRSMFNKDVLDSIIQNVNRIMLGVFTQLLNQLDVFRKFFLYIKIKQFWSKLNKPFGERNAGLRGIIGRFIRHWKKTDEIEKILKDNVVEHFEKGPGFSEKEKIYSQKNLFIDSEKNKSIFLSEEEIVNRFLDSGDKNKLIFELFDNGCNLNLISKCSGIPVGEVKLIIDLNNCR